MASHNKGKITGSTVGALLTGKGDTLLKGGIQFARQIAMERLGVVDDISTFKGNAATEWGNENEPIAIEAYEANTFNEVHGQQKQATKGNLSCTPDGFIGDIGLIEVKCPYNSTNHLNNLLENSFVKQYESQCRFNMMLTATEYCDLISFDPRFPQHLRIHVATIERDTEWEDFCMNRIEQAEEIIANIIEKLG